MTPLHTARRAGLTLVVLAFLPGLACSGPGPGADQLVAEGHARYVAGDYAGAWQAYEQAQRAGAGSADLHYNFGNTAFRLGRPGLATLGWRRALWLDPGHEDARANLAYLQSRPDGPAMPGGADGTSPLLGGGWWDGLRIDTLGGLALAGLGLLGLTALAYPRLRRGARPDSAPALLGVVTVVTALLWVGWLTQIWRLETTRSGVVVTAEAEARSGPTPSSPVLFRLPEATEIEVRGEIDGWLRVVLPNGWNGWVPAQSVGLVQDTAALSSTDTDG